MQVELTKQQIEDTIRALQEYIAAFHDDPIRDPKARKEYHKYLDRLNKIWIHLDNTPDWSKGE
jgi:hypothetical protein